MPHTQQQVLLSDLVDEGGVMDGEDSKSPRLPPVRQRQKVQQQPSVRSSSVVEQPVPIPVSVSVPPDLADWIKLNANDLKISQRDRRWAAEMVNDFRDNLLKFLKKEPLFQSAEILNTGSYFEKVKIYSPDEFDMMLKFPVPSRFTTTKLDGGLFYRIDLVHAPQGPIRDFLLENQLTLSSTKLLTEMFRLVRKFLKTYRVPDNELSCHWEVNRKKPNSPAVTLSLCRPEIRGEELISVDVVPALESQSWPPATRNGPDVDQWLGKKSRQEIRNQPCYFVPKRLKGRNQSEDAKESWRISFSHIEKKIITSHGNKKTCCESHSTKCCRKPCLMLLKSLIEGLKQRFPKELDELCSYHGKTVFLHTLASRFDDSQWACQQLPVCFLYLVDALQDHARRGDLPHFFVPECNLFSPTIFHRRALAFLVRALDEQKREGLPLLKPPALVSPLKPTTAAAEIILEKPTEESSLLHTASYMKLLLLSFLVVLFVFSCFWD